MDPVNKWLTTVILFMIGVLIVLGYTAGSGKYEFVVAESTLLSNHAVVYVLNTKTGNVDAQLVDENELHYKNNPRSRSKRVLTLYTSRY